MTNDPYTDKYADYEARFDPLRSDRKARRKRKPQAHHEPKTSDAELVETVTDVAEGLEGGFHTTYEPSRYEAVWLKESLRPLYDQSLISDVLAVVKGGKEASVYRCAGHETTGVDLLAAKVYRPRMFRQLRNDKMYREGRQVLTADGKPVKETDHRVMRAIGKKTAYGQQVSHTSWLLHEYNALDRLHRAGASVPKPYGYGENAILMSYHGDASLPAPTLNEVGLEPDEAEPLLDEILRTVEIMLQHGYVHGDLSAYNVLYWEGAVTVIDFPQVVEIDSNPNALAILARDLQRVCDYFARQGAVRDPQQLTNELWERYGRSWEYDGEEEE